MTNSNTVMLEICLDESNDANDVQYVCTTKSTTPLQVYGV